VGRSVRKISKNKSRGPAKPAGPLLIEKAYAKVNLTLRILGRRRDGYHEIESLVGFADVSDRLSLHPGRELTLVVRGPLADHAGNADDNLVVKAAQALARIVPKLKTGRFTLTKQLPAQAGLGGGSADAAAALRLLARANRLRRDDPRLHQAARETGADVPVCLDPQPRWMTGVGEILSAPVHLPRFYAVLVRPDIALPTKDVFAALDAPPLEAKTRVVSAKVPADKSALLEFLASHGNDLERPATKLAPPVGDALALLWSQPPCILARMSGSGSACFGLFASRRAAGAAARAIAKTHPDWWVKPTTIGTVQ
jgi:4-diphosphocytidyl-2-C-methyl-D-erythritol kinase